MTLLFLPLDIKIVSYLCLQPPAMKSGGKKKELKKKSQYFWFLTWS